MVRKLPNQPMIVKLDHTAAIRRADVKEAIVAEIKCSCVKILFEKKG
jgi:hypothetical protein